MLVKIASHGQKIENQKIQISHSAILEFNFQNQHVKIEITDCTSIGTALVEPVLSISVNAGTDLHVSLSDLLNKIIQTENDTPTN